ncbi:hypothetical protein I3843_05G155000 [Carya illinoinensis]|nr:hypothetical protein I3843_05G155000 [Carya illinoinensis]
MVYSLAPVLGKIISKEQAAFISGRNSKKLGGWKRKLLSFGGKIILLKHVLNSIPIHMLSVLKIPKGVYDRIRNIFSDFLWGSSSEIRKRKWVSWNVICKPVEEGRLRVRDLMEVQESLFMKFDHVYKAIQVQKGTRFWKGVAELMPRVIKNSKWLVGNGNVNFWMDNWVGCGPLHDFCPVIGNIGLKVAEVFDNRGPKLEVISDLVPDEPNNSDVLIWKHTVEGKFTTKSAWELSREKGQIYEWKKWAKRGAVPTDDRVQRLNIPLVSKCQCCVIPDVESLNHVLCAGPEVQKVWRYFAEICNVRLPHIRNWKGMMLYWWQKAKKNTQVGWLRGVIPIMISWALWKSRCLSRIEGVPFSIDIIIRQVKWFLQEACCSVQSFHKINTGDYEIMQRLNLPIIPTRKKQLKYIKWEMPEVRTVKLNVDGGARNNPGEAGGGGIIRDSRGRCIAGFAHNYGIASNTVAECRALLDGLRLCKQLKFQNVLVESDYMVVMDWVTSGGISREISARFRHIFREANMVVNFLAKEGVQGVVCDFLGLDFENSRLRGLIRMDRLGMVSIREM